MRYSSYFALVFLVVMAAGFAQAAEGEGVKWNADVRFRHEQVSQSDVAVTAPTSYQQQKLMFRVGGTAVVNSTADVTWRLATGTGRTSTNQILGTSNNGSFNYGIGLDQAYFNCHKVEGMNFYGGRVKNVFYTAGGSDLIWDWDMNFDGLALTYNHPFGDFSFFADGALFWMNKTSTIAKDNTLAAVQLGVKSKMADFDWSLGASIYNYSGMAGQAILDSTSKGNTSTSGTTFDNDYHLVNAGLEVGTKMGEAPVVVYGDYVTNSSVSDEKNGFIAGAKFGKTKKAGDMLLAYDYRSLKKDATVGSFVDGDTCVGAGTNCKSHRIKVGYSMSDNVSTTVTAFLGSKNIAATDTATEKRNKILIDLMYSF